MTDTSAMIRERLRRPANAVVDHGINLRGEPAPKPKTVSAVVWAQRAARRRREMPVDEITEIVAKFYGLSVEDVLDGRRTVVLAKARRVISHLAHSMARCSYPEIGRALKYCDHTTAMRGDRMLTECMQHDSHCAEEIQHLKALIEQQGGMR